MVIVVMGVSGCGKSTIGTLLAERLQLPFYDADDYHPPANVEKMSAGAPLTDEDRGPWLKKLAAGIAEWNEVGDAVLACSALKISYRDILRTGGADLVFVHLEATKEVFETRMHARQGHFFPAELIESQLATLEPPRDAIRVDVSAPPAEIVEHILRELKLRPVTE